MSKSSKKRNKPYRGPDAATGPRVHRYSVTEQSPMQSWWKEHKRLTLARAGLVGAALLLSWAIYGLVS